MGNSVAYARRGVPGDSFLALPAGWGGSPARASRPG
jgi:hypothetical protein